MDMVQLGKLLKGDKTVAELCQGEHQRHVGFTRHAEDLGMRAGRTGMPNEFSRIGIPDLGFID